MLSEPISQKYNLIQVSGLFKSGMQEYDKTISFVSIDKAKKIGWNPNTKLEDGLKKSIDYIRKHVI